MTHTAAPTKANAARWLDAHAGELVRTVQERVSDGRIIWCPGPRPVEVVRAGVRWRLAGSEVRTHYWTSVEACSSDGIVVLSLDDSTRTTYWVDGDRPFAG
jgi:hypothetical protein